MAKQTINIGAAQNDGTGDTLRAAGQKVNDNFDELYDDMQSVLEATEVTPAVSATGTLTLTDSPSDGEQVVIGSDTITYSYAPSAAAGNNVIWVDSGSYGSLDEIEFAQAIEELVNGVASSQPEVVFSNRAFTTPVTATSPSASLVVTASVPGVGGNAIATTETLTNGSWADATLTGGVDAVYVDPTEKADLVAGRLDPLQLPAETRAMAGGAEVTNSIVFIDDDVKEGVLTDILPLMQSKGIPYVFAVPTGLVGDPTFCDESDLATLVANGGELVAHSVTHPDLTTLGSSQIRDELKDSQEWLRSRGWATNHFVYPYSGQNAEIRSICSEYYDSANANYAPPGLGFPSMKWPRLALGAFQPNNPAGYQTTQDLKDAVDEAIASNLMLVFMTHVDAVEHGAQQQADLEEVIDYCIAQGANIRNWSDAWRIHGNAWESRTQSDGSREPSHMDCKGRARLQLEQPRRDVDYAVVTSATPPSKYRQGLYYIIVPAGSGAGFPADAGILWVEKIRSSIGYTKLRFMEFDGGGIWNCTALTGDTWGPWVSNTLPLPWKAYEPRVQFQPQAAAVDGSSYMTDANLSGAGLGAVTFDSAGKWDRSGNWNEMVRGTGTGVDSATGEFEVAIPSLERWTIFVALRLPSNPAAISTAFSIGNDSASEAGLLVSSSGNCRFVSSVGTLLGDWVALSSSELSVVGLSWDGSALWGVMPDGTTTSLAGATQGDPAVHVRLSGKLFSWDGCPIAHGGFTVLPLALSQIELVKAQAELKTLYNH